MDHTTARASANEMGDVKWLTKNQFLAHQVHTEGIANESDRLNLWEKAFVDPRVEKRGPLGNPTVPVSLPPVTRA
eukprot:6028450-Prorocentrum_lima.AAC.1